MTTTKDITKKLTDAILDAKSDEGRSMAVNTLSTFVNTLSVAFQCNRSIDVDERKEVDDA